MPTQIPRVGIPQAPRASLRLPQATPSNIGEKVSALGDELVAFAKAKQDINDTIEANELLAEHSLAARAKQSEILRSDRDEIAVVTDYQKELETINQGILGKARSENVRNMLANQLPQRSAAKMGEIQSQSDQRFVARALGDFDRATTANTRDYLTAPTWQDREEIKNRQLSSIEVLASRGVFNPAEKEKAIRGFTRAANLFDIQREIQYDHEFGKQALMNPEKILEKYPGVTIDDLDNIYSGSVQAEELQRKNLERKREEVREHYESTVDEAGIRGQLTWEQLRALDARGLVTPETYRRNAQLIQKSDQEGGIDDPNIRGELETRIRLNPFSVRTSEILDKMNEGRLSRKTANELFDLRQKWEKSLKEDAESPDPRLKGVLFREGAERIDQTVGRGLTVSGYEVDDNTRRRWAAAKDLYLERVMKERDKPQHQIATEVIEMYRGPVKPAEILPERYKSSSPRWKDKGGINWAILKEDYRIEKDPNRKKELAELIDRLQRSVTTDY